MAKWSAHQREALSLVDLHAQWLQAAGADVLRTALSQTTYRHDPVYRRLEGAQTLVRCDPQRGLWWQLMQTYWSLGAKGWMDPSVPGMACCRRSGHIRASAVVVAINEKVSLKKIFGSVDEQKLLKNTIAIMAPL